MVNNPNNPTTADGLSDQQRAVLQHIRLFRITTQDLARRGCFARDATPSGVDSFFVRLRKRGLVRAAQLMGTEKYYYLTQGTYQSAFGEAAAEERVGSFAVVEWYGRLLFCMRRPDVRKKLHWSEFDRLFPQLHDDRQPRRHVFYIDKESGQSRLGLIYVDPGNRFDRVANRLRNQLIGKLLAQAAWREHVIDGDRLTIAIVCTSAMRAAQLQQELDPASQWPRIRFCFESFQELLPLVHRRHAESNRNRNRKPESM
jgi:hypothetical protein